MCVDIRVDVSIQQLASDYLFLKQDRIIIVVFLGILCSTLFHLILNVRILINVWQRICYRVMNCSLITYCILSKSAFSTFPFSSHGLYLIIVKFYLGMYGSLNKRLVMFKINTCSSWAQIPPYRWLLIIKLLIIGHIVAYWSIQAGGLCLILIIKSCF